MYCEINNFNIFHRPSFGQQSRPYHHVHSQTRPSLQQSTIVNTLLYPIPESFSNTGHIFIDIAGRTHPLNEAQ